MKAFLTISAENEPYMGGTDAVTEALLWPSRKSAESHGCTFAFGMEMEVLQAVLHYDGIVGVGIQKPKKSHYQKNPDQFEQLHKWYNDAWEAVYMANRVKEIVDCYRWIAQYGATAGKKLVAMQQQKLQSYEKEYPEAYKQAMKEIL